METFTDVIPRYLLLAQAYSAPAPVRKMINLFSCIYACYSWARNEFLIKQLIAIVQKKTFFDIENCQFKLVNWFLPINCNKWCFRNFRVFSAAAL